MFLRNFEIREKRINTLNFRENYYFVNKLPNVKNLVNLKWI